MKEEERKIPFSKILATEKRTRKTPFCGGAKPWLRKAPPVYGSRGHQAADIVGL